MKNYDGIALFSGGLDSILAARLLMEQGRKIKCLHFCSPFFGHPHRIEHWQNVYGLDISPVDEGQAFVEMLVKGPAHGFGSAMNPCVDCKILMMSLAREKMKEYGASFLVSGEVLGQRPMSQRRDTLNIIRRDAGVKNILVRPLCAQLLDPTEPELSGLIDRTRLLNFNGRGRKSQLALAEHFGITEIPTPGGGCKLTEKENTRRFWPVLSRISHADVNDFMLADVGRQFWQGDFWLSIGRHKEDNEAYSSLIRSGDMLFKVAGFPGPLGLGRSSRPWSSEAVREAAALVASYSPKACRAAMEGQRISVRVTSGTQ
ncbi:MAG: tRNA(5-methylaminomethyl-2-thiouridylate) methyltransferase, partial [Mailhella sp.]